ncbi:enoyl-CoA hydratase-related protein [Hephaestia sp. GCM10023244]|uniref:enoyl-CoA hydratase-related protein n=1 Tax=unclassified Hephaestia TaxID=2631281 RepID=UPI0020770563|nr:enoyl-CoA hydratase-related protein [Hephaestia sp. MAHUQ-44]MCM8732044.1 enoyl-CoA hydratase-related protein [Hephaestia sp. MAHUQ-44]
MTAIRREIMGAVARVTIDKPPVNAITLADYAALAETFDAIGKDDSIHCVVFTAAGTKAFCAGKDLHEFVTARLEDDEANAVIVREAFAAIRHCAVPVIAAVNGPALGAGCVLAAVADIRMASPAATFGLPEVNIGRCGGTAHVGRLISQGLLRRMVFTGRAITAEQALTAGLIDEIVDADKLLDAAHALADEIAKKSPLGLRLGKQSMNAAEFLPVDEGYVLEQGYSTKLMATEDAREAVRAVVEKRAPVFKGR